ncbi:MAG TPA: tripartite tricarboxylate transporter substrate binding protein [Burkholderiales bacterium]|jgi:tripartite-type tricarboxylate transporter receptor subunit TctC
MPTLTRPRFTGLALAALAFAAAAPIALAQDYPAKQITIVVPFAAGSATDQQARAYATAITAAFKVPVVVDDRPGASGMIAAQYVAKAAPDGYTMLFTTNTTHAANEHLYKKLPYDPVKDFSPVALLSKGYQVMVVRPDAPYHSVAEFIAAAKAQKGKLSFGSGSSSSRVAGEAFKQMTGTEILHVPYKSNPLALTDVLGGQVTVMWTDMTTGVQQINGGKLKALGVTSLKRSPQLPNVPTIDEAGVKGYESSYWNAAYMPAGVPPAYVKRMSDLLVRATTTAPAVTSLAASTGTEPATMGPEGLAKFQAQESAKWARIIKAAGIEPE